jgi:hypothetical protein
MRLSAGKGIAILVIDTPGRVRMPSVESMVLIGS